MLAGMAARYGVFEEATMSRAIAACVGIDLGKTNFHMAAWDASGAVSKRQVARL